MFLRLFVTGGLSKKRVLSRNRMLRGIFASSLSFWRSTAKPCVSSIFKESSLYFKGANILPKHHHQRPKCRLCTAFWTPLPNIISYYFKINVAIFSTSPSVNGNVGFAYVARLLSRSAGASFNTWFIVSK